VADDARLFETVKGQIRVFELAKAYGIDTSGLLELCGKLGIAVKNQLSSLSISDASRVAAVIARFLPDAVRSETITVATKNPTAVGESSQLGAQPHVQVRRRKQLPLGKYPGIERLIDVGERVGMEKLELIVELAELDPECAMFKVRKLIENLCCMLLKEEKCHKLLDSIDRQTAEQEGDRVFGSNQNSR
jgi:hypothetical protein